MSCWCWQTTETIYTKTALPAQPSDQCLSPTSIFTLRHNTQPFSHHTTLYWTYWTLEYTYSSCAYLVPGSRIQLELVNDQPDHLGMAVLSCPVDHGPSTIGCAVEQWLHIRGQVVDGVDMATLCSKVQGIVSTLRKEWKTSEHSYMHDCYRSGGVHALCLPCHTGTTIRLRTRLRIRIDRDRPWLRSYGWQVCCG